MRTISLRSAQARTIARQSESAFTMLDGLLSWTPVFIEPTRCVINFAGVMPETNFCLGFQIDGEGGTASASAVKCFLLENGQNMKRDAGGGSRFAYSADAKKFAKERVELLREYINRGAHLLSPSDIVKTVQMVEMNASRIEMLAKELSVIGSEYESLLEVSERALRKTSSDGSETK